MPTPRHLVNAPITEAIIDFRVKSGQEINPKVFEPLKASLAADFPKALEQTGGTFSFEIGPTGVKPAATKEARVRGLILRSNDEKLLAQFRVDGFTLNRLKPYTSWRELFPVAMRLWDLYRFVALPSGVTRLAVRYINSFLLPPDFREMPKYLRAVPTLPPELPRVLSDFQTRTTIRDEASGAAARVVQVLQSTPNERASMILDIDAFTEAGWSPDDPGVAVTLERLRDLKNLIFFNWLTDEMLRQFE